MEEQTIFGDDVVVSASRVESILQSPVSEKIDVLDVQAAIYKFLVRLET